MTNKQIITKLANQYRNLALYWTGKRSVMGYQTVEYISEQAASCARLAAHYSLLEQKQTT